MHGWKMEKVHSLQVWQANQTARNFEYGGFVRVILC